MSLSLWLRNLLAVFRRKAPPSPAGELLPVWEGEDITGIRELSRLVQEDTDAPLAGQAPANSEFFTILGNVFRAQGDIDRAVRLRETLLARATLSKEERAAVHFELGCDYRRAGLHDRSLAAYKEARRQGYSEDALSRELALLAADSGDYETAAAESAKSGNIRAQACYLVRLAEEEAARRRDTGAVALIKRALRIYPGSPEAWLRLVCINLLGGNAKKASLYLHSGIDITDASGRLILLEGLYAVLHGPAAPGLLPEAVAALALEFGAFLADRKNDVVLCYYAGLLLHMSDKRNEAEQWFTKALVLDPEFWAARLAILGLCAGRETLPLLLAQQIDFFVRIGANAKRFRCLSCGMRRDTIFSFCPRCHAWHSAAFRTRLS